jgi:hypothetical protein
MDVSSTDAFIALLKVITNPAASKAKLDELLQAKAEVRVHAAAAAVAKKRNDAKCAELEAREAAVAKREAAFTSQNGGGFALFVDISATGVAGYGDMLDFREREAVKSAMRMAMSTLDMGPPADRIVPVKIDGVVIGQFGFADDTANGKLLRPDAA